MIPLPPVSTRALRFALLPLVFLSGTFSVVEARDFVLLSDQSQLTVHVPKAGVFSFAGHEHTIEATSCTGTLRWDAGAARPVSLTVTIPVSGLTVTDEHLSAKDRGKVQVNMQSADVLDLANHATITFTADAFLPAGTDAWEVVGTLTVAGRTAETRLRAHITPTPGGPLHASGEVVLALASFGIAPVKALGGTVRTGESVTVRFDVVLQDAAS